MKKPHPKRKQTKEERELAKRRVAEWKRILSANWLPNSLPWRN